MSFKLFTDPANEASPKVTFPMFILTGGESLREHLVWRENLEKVMVGLNLDNPTKKQNTILQLVRGAAMTSYIKGQKTSVDTLWEVQREAAAQAVRGNVAGREGTNRSRPSCGSQARPTRRRCASRSPAHYPRPQSLSSSGNPETVHETQHAQTDRVKHEDVRESSHSH